MVRLQYNSEIALIHNTRRNISRFLLAVSNRLGIDMLELLQNKLLEPEAQLKA